MDASASPSSIAGLRVEEQRVLDNAPQVLGPSRRATPRSRPGSTTASSSSSVPIPASIRRGRTEREGLGGAVGRRSRPHAEIDLTRPEQEAWRSPPFWTGRSGPRLDAPSRARDTRQRCRADDRRARAAVLGRPAGRRSVAARHGDPLRLHRGRHEHAVLGRLHRGVTERELDEPKLVPAGHTTHTKRSGAAEVSADPRVVEASTRAAPSDSASAVASERSPNRPVMTSCSARPARAGSLATGHRSASASKSTCSGSGSQGKKISSSQPASANARTFSRTVSGSVAAARPSPPCTPPRTRSSGPACARPPAGPVAEGVVRLHHRPRRSRHGRRRRHAARRRSVPSASSSSVQLPPVQPAAWRAARVNTGWPKPPSMTVGRPAGGRGPIPSSPSRSAPRARASRRGLVRGPRSRRRRHGSRLRGARRPRRARGAHPQHVERGGLLCEQGAVGPHRREQDRRREPDPLGHRGRGGESDERLVVGTRRGRSAQRREPARLRTPGRLQHLVAPGPGIVDGRPMPTSMAEPYWRRRFRRVTPGVEPRSLRLAVRDARPTVHALINHASSSSAWPPAAAGPRARPTSRPGATWCGPTSPTTGCCAGTSADGNVSEFRSPAGYTNGHTVDRQAGWSAASTSPAGSPEPRSTARSPCWPTATRASA